MLILFLQESSSGDIVAGLDWLAILKEGGVYPLLIWLIYDNIHLRKANDKLNEETRATASEVVSAMVRLASERK